MKISTLLLILILSSLSVYSQGWFSVGARSISLANASVTIPDVWAYHHNPGALGEVRQISVGASYENRFLMKELQSQGLAFALPLKYGTISIGAQLFGYKQFRTQRVGAGYSLKLAKFLFAGVQLNYQGYQFNDNYGRYNGITAEAGIQAFFAKNIRLGFSVTNIGRMKVNEFEDERLATNFRLGVSYDLSNKVLFLLEVSKTIIDKPKIKFGVEYQPVNNLFIRLGVAGVPIEYTFGIGYKWKVISIDAGTAYNPNVGWSPCFSLTYIAKKIKE
jgi:hypothetical protein